MSVIMGVLVLLNLLYAAIGFARNSYGQALFNLVAAVLLMVTLTVQNR